MDSAISTLVLSGLLIFSPAQKNEFVSPVAGQSAVIKQPQKEVLASETLDLSKRNPDKVVSDVFRDNILLNLHYIKGDTDSVKYHANEKYYGENMIDWEKVRESFEFTLSLEPGELLAFHDQLLPEFQNMKVKTGWTQFSVEDGYKVMDGLPGDGVCHLATLINWVSSEAGLSVTAKVNHDFYPVPGVDRKYGTSIVYIPGAETTKMQNLYVINTFSYPVIFHFTQESDRVNLRIER